MKLYYSMLDTKAWLSLPAAAQAFYVRLRRRFNGINNGDIHMSQREAQRELHIRRGSIGRCEAALVERGFIVATSPPRRRGRVATHWRLTELPMNDLPATRDFELWRPHAAAKTGPTAGSELDPQWERL